MANNSYVEDSKNIFASFECKTYLNDGSHPASKSCLDHFLIKNTTHEESSRSFISEQQITDHKAISLFINFDETIIKETIEKKL